MSIHRRVLPIGAPLLIFTCFITLWQLRAFHEIFGVGEYAVPIPSAILAAFADGSGELPAAFWQSGVGLALGWIIGNVVGFVVGAVLTAFSPGASRRLASLCAGMQALPIIGIAPIVAFWISASTPFKAATVAIVIFPAMVVYTYRGAMSVSPMALEIAASLDASRFQVFRFIRLPSAVPYLFTSLRYSVVLGLIATFLCEILRSADGLGYEIFASLQRFDSAQAFAAVAVLAAVGIVAYCLLLLLERILAPWGTKLNAR